MNASGAGEKADDCEMVSRVGGRWAGTPDADRERFFMVDLRRQNRAWHGLRR